MANIAFLGTGIMGLPMARNLAKAGHSVTAWNRSAQKAQPLQADGCRIADTPRAAVQGADVVIVMVSSGPVSDAVLFGEDGAAAGLTEGAAVVMMSSIPVETARAQAEKLAAQGVDYVDAPVSGGEKGAIEATLTIMAGGDDAVVERLRPVIEAMGRLTRIGPVGTGQLAKLANQTIVGITIGAVSEAFLLAQAGGADLAALRNALAGGFADSTILRQHGERMITGNFTPGAHASTQLKDLRTSRELAETLDLDLPILSLLESLYVDMCNHGRQDLDHSGLFVELAARGKGRA